jgi:hypothetical protein
MIKCLWLKPIAIIQHSRAGTGRAGAMAVSAAAILDKKIAYRSFLLLFINNAPSAGGGFRALSGISYL